MGVGGWVSSNVQLGPRSARVILNEVTSTNPSQLRGVIEVAGHRADIVIANPNGITCDGCGFLNTPRATLSTGSPQFDGNGALTGLDVRQGHINITPGGLTATNVEQLDLIARGLVIEGEVWAQNLNALAGANQVLYGTLTATSQSGTGAPPRFAIDIKDLGGMYTNQIFMIATEKGLVVNSTINSGHPPPTRQPSSSRTNGHINWRRDLNHGEHGGSWRRSERHDTRRPE